MGAAIMTGMVDTTDITDTVDADRAPSLKPVSGTRHRSRGRVYLSEIVLDTSRRASGMILSDVYALHQTFTTAFVHTGENLGRVLYRIERERTPDGPLFRVGRTPNVKILVQSQDLPNWNNLQLPRSERAAVLSIRGPKEWKLVDRGEPIFTAGQRLRFRLRANPVRRVEGRKLGITNRYQQGEWLARQGSISGFEIDRVPQEHDWLNPLDDPSMATESNLDVRIVSGSFETGYKPVDETNAHVIKILGVDYDGLLTVTDPMAFATAVELGLGSGRAFGFGLLSVSRPSAG